MADASWANGWARRRRAHLTWHVIEHMEELRSDLRRVRNPVRAAQSNAVAMCDQSWQVPPQITSSVTFVRQENEVLFLTSMQLWLVQGLAGDTDIDELLAQVHMEGPVGNFTYEVSSSGRELKARSDHRLEWLAIRHVDRVVTADDFELNRISRRLQVFRRETSAATLLQNGMHAPLEDFPKPPALLQTEAPLPEGLSIPPLLTLHHFGEWARVVLHLDARRCWFFCCRHPPGPHVTARFERAVVVEYAIAIVVGCYREWRANDRVAVLTQPIFDLVLPELSGAVRETRFGPRPDDEQYRVWDILLLLSAAFQAPPSARVSVQHHLATSPTLYVPTSAVRPLLPAVWPAPRGRADDAAGASTDG